MKDLVGKRYGHLVVVGYAGRTKNDNPMWKCKWDGGDYVTVSETYLKSGRKKQFEVMRGTHNESRTRLYGIWSHMKSRCYNPHNNRFKYYGMRGITVCDEWLHNYVAFRYWARSHGYKDNLSIDRIDNNKGYSPDNCRWATSKMQSNNRRSNMVVEINGVTKTMAQLSEELGVNMKKVKTLCNFHPRDNGTGVTYCNAC